MSFERRLQHLLSFRELWYFNAKVHYYCSLAYFIQYKKLAWDGRNYVEKKISSFMFKYTLLSSEQQIF